MTDNHVVIDMWKVTAYMELTRTIAANTLHQLISDGTIEKTRLTHVGIMHNFSVVRNDLFDVVKSAPKTVKYYLSPLNPDIFAFIDMLKRNGANDIRYLCDNHHICLSALMCQQLHEYNFPIEYAMGMVPYTTISVQDVYQLMSPELQQKWHIFYKMLSIAA